MKALLFEGNQNAVIKDIPNPEAAEGEVLVEMKASGVCGSDMQVYSSQDVPEEWKYLPRGHEPCGVVVELGPCTRNVKIGDRVIIHHYKGCGECHFCCEGWTQLCKNEFLAYGFGGGGGHADFGVFPDRTCVKMPDDLNYAVGATCSCGTGTAFQALKRMDVSAIDTVVIYGQGPVGLSAMMFAKAMGAMVIVVDINDSRLQLSEQLGADYIINSFKVDPVIEIQKLTKGKGADACMECTGKAESCLNVLKCVKTWGRVCFVGVSAGDVNFQIFDLFIKKQLSVYGSWTMSTHVLSECANFIVDRDVKIIDMIETFSIADGIEVYKRFSAGKTDKKPVFVW